MLAHAPPTRTGLEDLAHEDVVASSAASHTGIDPIAHARDKYGAEHRRQFGELKAELRSTQKSKAKAKPITLA